MKLNIKKVISPSPHLADPTERVRASMLSSLCLFFIPCVLFFGSLYHFKFFNLAFPDGLTLMFFGSFVFLLASVYILSRTRYYQVGGILLTGVADLILAYPLTVAP